MAELVFFFSDGDYKGQLTLVGVGTSSATFVASGNATTAQQYELCEFK